MTPPEGLELTLASGSPRRSAMLRELGLTLVVVPPNVDETPQPGEAPAPYVQRLALEKAAQVSRQSPGRLVLAADTTVALGSDILGKPADAAEARAMLSRLSGARHEVFTGVALDGTFQASVVVRTQVTFRALSRAEIDWYVETGEPLDKAGAYAVQGKGSAFVTSIEGSPSNVIGLPLAETIELLARAGLVLPWRPR